MSENTVKVYLCSTFRLTDGPDTVVREVELDRPVADYTSEERLLSDVFRLGQNDFQPQQKCSVSVGDVIVLDTKLGEARKSRYFRIASCGFDRIGGDIPDAIRGQAAQDLGSFGKLLGDGGMDPDSRDYTAESSRHAAYRHYGIGR